MVRSPSSWKQIPYLVSEERKEGRREGRTKLTPTRGTTVRPSIFRRWCVECGLSWVPTRDSTMVSPHLSVCQPSTRPTHNGSRGWKNRTSGETNMTSPWPKSRQNNRSSSVLRRSDKIVDKDGKIPSGKEVSDIQEVLRVAYFNSLTTDNEQIIPSILLIFSWSSWESFIEPTLIYMSCLYLLLSWLIINKKDLKSFKTLALSSGDVTDITTMGPNKETNRCTLNRLNVCLSCLFLLSISLVCTVDMYCTSTVSECPWFQRGTFFFFKKMDSHN